DNERHAFEKKSSAHLYLAHSSSVIAPKKRRFLRALISEKPLETSKSIGEKLTGRKTSTWITNELVGPPPAGCNETVIPARTLGSVTDSPVYQSMLLMSALVPSGE